MPGELTPRGLKTCSDTNTSAAPPLFIPTAHPWGQPAKRSLNFPDPQSGPARHLRAAAAPLRPRSLCGDSPQPPPARPLGPLGPLGPLPGRYPRPRAPPLSRVPRPNPRAPPPLSPPHAAGSAPSPAGCACAVRAAEPGPQRVGGEL